MNDLKQQVLDEIRAKSEVFKRSSDTEFRIRCPICGDSQKNPRDAHCYIKCSMNPEEPLLYNCFKCNSGGKVNKWFLDKLGVDPAISARLDKQKFNRIISPKVLAQDMVLGNVVMNSRQVKYIENRLGSGFTKEDYERFKIVWDMNNIFPFITNKRVMNTMPSNNDSISFVSDDKTMILSRSFMVDDESQWRKIRIIPSDNKSFYTIKATMDLFTSETIVINIAEGIFDILSVYKNFNDCPNSAFIAALGSDYISALDYLIAKGLFGYNVEVRVYIDDGIDEKALRYELSRRKWMFKGIYVLKNIKYKDVGVSIDNIKLVERRI